MFFDKFSNKASELFLISQKEAETLGHSKIDPEHLLLAMLKDPTNLVFNILMNDYNVDYASVREETVKTLGKGVRNMLSMSPQISEKLKKILEMAFEESKMFGQSHINVEHIFLAILRENQNGAVRILNRLNVNTASLGRELMNRMNPSIMSDEKGSKANNSYVLKQLEEFGENLNALAEAGKLDPVIGRKNEIDRLMQVLARRKKNNPVLIGEPGVGKTAIVDGLVERIVREEVPEILKDKVIFSLDIASLVAGTKYRGEFEKRLKKLMQIIKQDENVIIFIDEIHTIVGAGAAEGAVDAANILKPALSSGDIRCIGATTPNEYRKYIEKDAALERRFQKIFVQEPTPAQTIDILKGLKEKYELHHNVQYTDEAIEESVKLSRTYVTEHFLPDMAIDVIDEAGAKKRLNSLTMPDDLKKMEMDIQELKQKRIGAAEDHDFVLAKKYQNDERELVMEFNKQYQEWRKSVNSTVQVVTLDDISGVISGWTGIPLSRIEEDESTRLLNLESAFHNRIVAQEEAVEVVSKSVRRARSGLKDPNRPVGTFLFLGPTGVGKTEMAKTLAEYLFGDETALVRYDMSEYMERFAVSRLIGAPPGYVGYDEGGTLTEIVRRRPYSVILLDEIEKAHPDVYNILLQIADEGRLTDSQGRIVDFRNTVIILTSNIGGEIINKSKHVLGFDVQEDDAGKYKDMKSTVLEEVKKVFRPEFLNRLDEIIVFHQLSKEHLGKIVEIMINKLKLRLNDKKIDIELKESANEFLVEKGYDAVYGARPLKRAIQRYIEDPLSEEILKRNFVEGDTVIVTTSKKNEIVFKKKTTKNLPEKTGAELLI